MGQGKGLPHLDRVADRVELRYANSKTDLEVALPGAEVALMWDFRSSLLRESLRHADVLRWVHVAGAGVDAIVSPLLAASDIVLTNARGVFDH